MRLILTGLGELSIVDGTRADFCELLLSLLTFCIILPLNYEPVFLFYFPLLSPLTCHAGS